MLRQWRHIIYFHFMPCRPGSGRQNGIRSQKKKDNESVVIIAETLYFPGYVYISLADGTCLGCNLKAVWLLVYIARPLGAERERQAYLSSNLSLQVCPNGRAEIICSSISMHPSISPATVVRNREYTSRRSTFISTVARLHQFVHNQRHPSSKKLKRPTRK